MFQKSLEVSFLDFSNLVLLPFCLLKIIFDISLIASVAIYVGNLDDDINENDLKAAFEVFGEIL